MIVFGFFSLCFAVLAALVVDKRFSVASQCFWKNPCVVLCDDIWDMVSKVENPPMHFFKSIVLLTWFCLR